MFFLDLAEYLQLYITDIEFIVQCVIVVLV